MPAPPIPALDALAGSGVPALTGWPDGPPVAPPLTVAERLGGIVEEITALTGANGHPVSLDWGQMLTGRAAVLGLRRAGTTSANGSCRLLRSADGWIAINLARPADREAIPALTSPASEAFGKARPPAGEVDPLDPWSALAAAAAILPGAVLEAQAGLLGVPLGLLRRPRVGQAPVLSERRWRPDQPRRLEALRVVDLSSMWAGPLASAILAAAGAKVTKVELAGRPDGAHATPVFYRWLHHHDQDLITVDVRTSAGRDRLRALLAGADVVVDSARPRALAHLGAGPDDLPPRDGRIWLAVSGHGRRGPGANRVGFGDDAAVAGGLVGWDGDGDPVFLADAVADPATGLVAAAAVLRALQRGGGQLVDVAMAGVAAWLAQSPRWGQPPASPTVIHDDAGVWWLTDGTGNARVRPPVPAAPLAGARAVQRPRQFSW